MRKLSQHQISFITALLGESKKELELAKTIDFYRSIVARYVRESLRHT